MTLTRKTLRTLRAALTETRNVYGPMPGTVGELGALSGRLADVRDANLRHHEELIARAGAAGAEVVGLGELFAAPYFALTEDALWRDLAEPIDTGPTITAMRDAAAKNGVVLIAPIYELDPGTGKRFNTAVVIEKDGRVLGSYRKTHIPCGANEEGAFFETFYYERSDGGMNNEGVQGQSPFFPVFSTSVGKIGVAICYDRHFEGVMSTLAAGGAKIVFCPAVTFGGKSEELWPHEFQTDATRHGIFIGGSNRHGGESPWDVEYFGASRFWSPDGPLPDLSDHPQLVISDLDLNAPRNPDPAGWNLQRDRRPEVF